MAVTIQVPGGDVVVEGVRVESNGTNVPYLICTDREDAFGIETRLPAELDQPQTVIIVLDDGRAFPVIAQAIGGVIYCLPGVLLQQTESADDKYLGAWAQLS